MDLEALRTFIAVVDGGSLLGGAERLGASRATVRRRLEELEAAAGVALLHRGPQGVAPTAAGELLVRRGRMVLSEAELLFDSVRSMGAEPVGTVRVAAPVGMPPQMLAMMFQALRARWPGLHCDLCFSDRPVDSLLTGAEVAISLERAHPEGPFEAIELPAAREWLQATPRYLERHGPIELETLARQPLLLWRSPEGDVHAVPTLDGGLIEVRPILITTDIHMLRLTAASGVALLYGPDAHLPEPAGASLVPVLQDRVGRRRPVRLVVRTAIADLPKIKVILDAVRSLLSKRGVG